MAWYPACKAFRIWPVLLVQDPSSGPNLGVVRLSFHEPSSGGYDAQSMR